MATMTLPGRSQVAGEIRLLFGPQIDDIAIEAALQLAVDDLRVSVAPDRLLEKAMRLAVVRLDAVSASMS